MAGEVIQSLWVGPRLSAMGRLGLQSFVSNGHAFHLYTFGDVDNVPAGVTLRDASEILPRERVFAYRTGFGKGSHSGGSNFFRYKLLLERGGWWVDTDVVCLQPFDFSNPSVIAAEDSESNPGEIRAASNVLKQPVGSPLMRWAWRACRERDPETIHWDETGPSLVHEGVRRLGMEDDLCLPNVFNPVPYFAWKTLIEPDDPVPLGAGVYAVHLWHQMWREHGVDPDGRFPETSLYEQLKRRFASRP